MSRSFTIMNKLFFTVTLVALMLAAATPCFPAGKSITMGTLISVMPDRSLDAARNPALLGMPGDATLLGLNVTAGSFIQDDVTLETGENPGSFNYDSVYTGSMNIGYAWRSGSLSYGVALYGNTDDDQISRSRTSVSAVMQAYISGPGDVILNFKQQETILEFNPTFNFAMAYRVGGTGYLGTQAVIGVTRKTVGQVSSSKVYDLSSVFLGSTDQEFNRTYNRLTVEAGFGYVREFDNGHTGVMIRTGALSAESIEGDVESDNSFSASSLRDSRKVSNAPRYHTGPMLLAGFYKKLVSRLGCAFEMAYRFPVSYSSSELDVEDDAVEEKSMIVDSLERFEIKGGMEYTLSEKSALTAGILYTISGKNLSDTGTYDKSKQTEKQDFSVMAVTIGYHYILDAKTSITAGAGLIRGRIEIERLLNVSLTRLDFSAGVSMGL